MEVRHKATCNLVADNFMNWWKYAACDITPFWFNARKNICIRSPSLRDVFAFTHRNMSSCEILMAINRTFT